jgi:hypothetical protein
MVSLVRPKFGPKIRLFSWSDSHGSFGVEWYCLIHSVSSLARANVLSKFELDADWVIDFATGILINRFNGLETFILSLIDGNQRSRFMLELMEIFVSIKNFETRCSNSAALLVQFWVDDTALLPLLLLKIRSVRMLATIVCSEPLVWLFSPAWDAVTITLDGSSALS